MKVKSEQYFRNYIFGNFCCRYGSDLVSVESFRQNNFTAELASEFLTGQEDSAYWLGLQVSMS
jgi:hypothetical protein